MRAATQPFKAESAKSWRDELRLQSRVTVPLAVAFLVELGIYLTDILVVGRLGALAFGAVGLAGAVMWELTYAGFSLLMIVGVVVAHGFGAGAKKEIASGARTGLLTALVISGPWILMGWFLTDIMALTDQGPEVMAVGQDYLRAMVWHLPASFMFMALRQLVTGLSRPIIITFIMIAAVPTNLVLNIVLVFGWAGSPELGVVGAGIATTVVAWAKLAVLVVYLARHSELSEFPPFRNLHRIDFAMWRQIWRLGLPVMAVRLVEGSMFQATFLLMGAFGATALAAHNVMVGALTLSVTLAVAFGHGASVRVAQELGGGHAQASQRAGWFAEGAIFVLVIPIALFICAAPDLITSIFLDPGDPANAATFELTRQLRWIAALFALVQAAEVVISRALRGRKDTMIPMLMAGAGFWLAGIPCGLLLSRTAGMGPMGLWIGMTVGFGVTAVLMLLRWQKMPEIRTG
ncbi:MAG: MATE family efflux transporter [Rhodospirillaceae bacterium]|nr:MATE family efflux transporter [Rhodospirillaceae bacterium]